MHPHEALLRRLFDRLAARDAAGAARCYHPDIFFTNPLYPRLRGPEVQDFWSMAFEALPDLALALDEVAADDDGGHARWHASYTIGTPPRHVATTGRSLFAFRDALVCRHYDHFSYWRWLERVFGAAGAAAGWFGPFRWAVRQRLARRLDRYRG